MAVSGIAFIPMIEEINRKNFGVLRVVTEVARRQVSHAR
jgi:hypothetical protein